MFFEPSSNNEENVCKCKPFKSDKIKIDIQYPSRKGTQKNKNFDRNDNSIDTARAQCKMQFSLIKDFSICLCFCVCSREKLQDKDLIFYLMYLLCLQLHQTGTNGHKVSLLFHKQKIAFYWLETFLMKSPGGLCWLIFMDFSRFQSRSGE